MGRNEYKSACSVEPKGRTGRELVIRVSLVESLT